MYPLVKIPAIAEKDIYSFSKVEAKEYYQWFISIKKDRLQILETSVKEIFPGWELDYTKKSLIILYEWFCKKVKYRGMTEKEKEKVKQQINKTPLLVGVIDIPENTFTDETVSICFDIGIYFGETLIHNVAGVNWTQRISSANFIDYAQPLIATKSSKVPINTRRIAETLARFKLNNSPKQISFFDLFNKLEIEFSDEQKSK